MCRIVLLLPCLWISTFLAAQPKTDSLLRNILLDSGSDLINGIIREPDTFRLQIIYTQINRDKKNNPSFKNHYFNVDPDLYFNPASTVKLPLAVLALEKLNRIGRTDIDKHTTILFDSSYSGQLPALFDSTSETNLPSIAHFIKRALLVSENEPYNRLYQFVGQGPINEWLREKGYQNTQITRQFMPFSEEQNRHTNQVRFLNKHGDLIYVQKPLYNTGKFNFDRIIKVGKAHYRNDSLIHAPIDFTRANNVSLEDLQQMLQSVLFPKTVPPKKRFLLTKDDEEFLFRYLSQYPSETSYPKYDTTDYYDSYVKFYFKSGSRLMPSHIRVFNKTGWAYGFLTDVSYVVDFANKVEFMLTATVYTNSDGILNDDQYDYEKTGWPFLFDLGQTIYRYELARPRKFAPDLKNFRIRYEKRDPRDTRRTIKNVDN